MNGSRAALPVRTDGARDRTRPAGGKDSGMPRLIVFSQARWSGKDGGRIALKGRRPKENGRAAAGHMRTRLQIMARHAAGPGSRLA
ncbi:hypothetical protein PSAB6_90072 [Paraburkholderia sabiae]|nr:hypothetical protein PSAB6_90072 [Paraburkholderia sabiae]